MSYRIVFLALLLLATSVAASPKSDYMDAARACSIAPPAEQASCYNNAMIAWSNSTNGPNDPDTDDITFIFDGSGRLVKLVHKDGTTLGEFGYDGDKPAPVVYTAHNGLVRWITGEDRQWVTEQVAQINPAMTDAELDVKLAELSTQWQRGETPALAQPEPNNACIANCDKFWMRGSLYCVNLFPVSHAWAARCALTMAAGDLLCRLACQPIPPVVYDHTWCGVYPISGWPAMHQNPENCGSDPFVLLERGCQAFFAGTSFHGTAFPVDPVALNGGFRYKADCYVPTGRVDFAYVDYVVLCRPGFAQSVALQWINTPDETLRHVCL